MTPSFSTRFVVKVSMIVAFGLVVLGAALSVKGQGAHALSAQRSVCASSDRTYIGIGGDTLSKIATRYGTDWSSLASYNHLASSPSIAINQIICIPGKGAGNVSTGNTTALQSIGSSNPFPYPSCTWWADQRYYQLHGVFVPWRTNSDAWQWTARAYQFGWHVSSSPSYGAIINLQPWVQGAYGLGHVAVVERILSNGHVIASNMSWGAYPYQVTYVEFAPGRGVTFISQ